MPIYEYGCPSCRTIFQFWTQRIGDPKVPSCPKCGNENMTKVMSSFAIGAGSKKPAGADAGGDEEGGPDPFAHMTPDQQARAEGELMRLMSQAENIDENDPRQMGAFLRKMTETTGMDLGTGMEEAIKRLERGEDPEKVEEDLGDVLGEAFGGDEEGGMGGGGGWGYDDTLYDL